MGADRVASRPLRPMLPFGMTPHLMAERSRDAALAFFRGAAQGWTKLELAAWLEGPYKAVAGLVDPCVAPPVARGSRPSIVSIDEAPPSLRVLDEEGVHALTAAAAAHALRCVADLSAGAPGRPLDEAVEKGSLVEALTLTGAAVYLPIHRPRLRLAVRVTSLVLADFLVRPEDYAGEVRTCRHCGVVLLGSLAKQRGACGEHVRPSGIVAHDGWASEDAYFELRQTSAR